MLKNRFDYNMSYAQLKVALDKAECRQSTGYKHKVSVAGFPYQGYPVEFKTVELSLGYSIIPKTRMVTKGDALETPDTNLMHSQHRHRQDLYSQ